MTDPAPATAAGPPSELDKLRHRVEALSGKRDEAEARLRALLDALLPLDDLLADTRRRAGALQAARSTRETASAAIALGEQVAAAHRMLRGEFARHDVAPMDVVGRAADPAAMRVVGTEPHPTRPHGTVLRERVTGFRMGTATLRPAQVVIAVPGPAPEPETPEEADADASAPGTPPAGGTRSQPRRTTRSQRSLPRKPSAGATPAPTGAGIARCPHRTSRPHHPATTRKHSSMHRTLGIDLGTTNSVTAWLHDGVPAVLPNRHGEQATPSVVGVDASGILLVGREALNWRDGDPRSVITEVKRLIGRRWDDALVQKALDTRPDDAPPVRAAADGSVEIRLGEHYLSPVQVSAVLLRRLKKDAEDAAGVPFRRAVITVPAYFAEPQFAAVREAGRLAGLHVARTVEEPTAAAHAFGVGPGGDVAEPSSMLVFDLGGGTFDVSMLTLGPGYFSVSKLGGDNLLGGADFDALLDGHLRRRLGGRDHSGETDAFRIRAAAERAKVELSTRADSDVTLAPLGREGGSWSGTVRRADFEELLTDHLRRMREKVEAVLTESGALPEDVQRVLLVGGSTRVPAVRRDLQGLFGEDKVSDAVDPMLAVAHGAAVEAGLLDTLDCPAETCTIEGIPVAEDACPGCGTPLVGRATVDCPGCHVPAPELTAACPVCATDLSGLRAAAATVTRTECPECGRDDNPATATACLDCDAPLDPGGLKCPGCGMVNGPGLTACSFCGGDFGTAPPQQVTAQHIGLELKDGTLEVLFPAGTPYPTEWHRVDDLAVRRNRDEAVLFRVWEGPHLGSAERNEFCGAHTGQGVEKTRGDVPIALQVRLDPDRTVDLRYRIASGPERGARLLRSTVSPTVGRKAAELHALYTGFLTVYRRELTPAEHDTLTELETDLATLARGEAVGRSLDGLLDSARDTLGLCKRARAVYAQAVLASRNGRGLLPPPVREELRTAADAVMDARRAMRVDALRSATERAEDLWTGLDPAVRTAIITVALAEQDFYPTTLRKEVLTARDALRDAVDRGDRAAQDTHLVLLGRLAEKGRGQFADVRVPSSAASVLPSRR